MTIPETAQSHQRGTTALGIDVVALDPADIRQAIRVNARGMRDNPLHIAAFGADPDIRLKKLERLFTIVLSSDKSMQHALVARKADGVIVGYCGMTEPGHCQPSTIDNLRMLPRILPLGLRSIRNTMRWMGIWAEHDPKERHWHLGPVAVDAGLQGQGIGTRMLEAFTAKLDAQGEVAYLETDKELNVTFYEHFSFEVVGQSDNLGVPNWYMLRRPRTDG